jgi:hypothetical protein
LKGLGKDLLGFASPFPDAMLIFNAGGRCAFTASLGCNHGLGFFLKVKILPQLLSRNAGYLVVGVVATFLSILLDAA